MKKHKNKISQNKKLKDEIESKCYLPEKRTDYHPKDSELTSTAPNGDTTLLPNPATDPIVCNNISYMEFDYTQSMANEMDDLESIKEIIKKDKKN
mgnify:CR=1 FL=1